jgi:hypothetical protein
MSFTIVTSYVNFYRTPIANHGPRLKQLQKLIDIGLPIVIFVTSDTKHVFAEKNPKHVHIVILPDTFFQTSFMYSIAERRKLPKRRLEPKDTFDYMCYQHSKVEFMFQATAKNFFHTEFFAWCDYDMMKNFNVSKTLKHIYTNGLVVQQDDIKQQIYFPGCWDFKLLSIQADICDQICWRFCGGFFLGTLESIVHLHTMYLAHFDTFLETYQTMIWDVNFWAYLEQEKGWNPIVYKANHDPSLVDNFPLAGYAHKLLLQKDKCIEYNYPKVNNSTPSSSSYIHWKEDQHILNTRYVNYRYLPSGHCVLQPDKKVCTTNVMAWLTPSMTVDIYKGFHEMEVSDSPELPVPDPNEQFQGVEDIRLYRHNGALKFIATSVNFSGCASSRMIYGDYDIKSFQLKNVKVLHHADNKKEKNWIPFESTSEPEKEYFVYSWNPVFQIGEVSGNSLKISHAYPTTILFPYKQMIKGSSNIIYDSYTKSYVAVVHICEERSLPKEYYHMLVWLDVETYRPTAYSKLFYFDARGPEFCLSMQTTKEQYIFWISRLDRDPLTVFVNRRTLEPLKN